eukprot:1143255-Pelagomonas_calceolata.AAC.2
MSGMRAGLDKAAAQETRELMRTVTVFGTWEFATWLLASSGASALITLVLFVHNVLDVGVCNMAVGVIWGLSPHHPCSACVHFFILLASIYFVQALMLMEA